MRSFILHPSSFILLLALLLLPSSFSSAATFYVTMRADSQSTNTVKLIRTGKVFADGTDVYTMVWSSATGNYVATLDDATFAEDLYRVEDGSANVVIGNYPVKINTTTKVADYFVRNYEDDQITGELTVKPASGTDTQFRVGGETDTSIYLFAENAAKSATRGLCLSASYLRMSGKILNLTAGTAAGDAVNFAQLDSTRGSAFTSAMTNRALNDRLDLLECATTFSGSPVCTLAAHGHRRGGIGLSWAMNTTADDTSVCRYELYSGTAAVPGHTAGTITTTQLANIRSRMDKLSLGGPQDHAAFVSTSDGFYFIVVCFDGDYPINIAASNQLWADAGNPLDSTIPIVGGAGDVAAGLTTLANKVDALDKSLGSGGVPKLLYCQHQYAATDTGTALALSVWIDSTGGQVVKVHGALYRDPVYDLLRIRCKIKTSSVSYPASFVINCSGLKTELTSTATTYETRTFTLDLATLNENLYEWYLELKSGASGKVATVTDVVVELLAQ